MSLDLCQEFLWDVTNTILEKEKKIYSQIIVNII